MSNFTKTVTLEIYSSDLADTRSRYILSRNLAICCDIFNRSTNDIKFENRGLKCKQFQNFYGTTLVVNGKYACQEAEDFDLLHNNDWIDTSCTMYSTKLFNQLRSIDELSYLRNVNLIDNEQYVQVEVDGKVVVVEQKTFEKHGSKNYFAEIVKGKNLVGILNQFLKKKK